MNMSVGMHTCTEGTSALGWCLVSSALLFHHWGRVTQSNPDLISIDRLASNSLCERVPISAFLRLELQVNCHAYGPLHGFWGPEFGSWCLPIKSFNYRAISAAPVHPSLTYVWIRPTQRCFTSLLPTFPCLACSSKSPPIASWMVLSARLMLWLFLYLCYLLIIFALQYLAKL